MDEKVLEILKDMQKDIKELKTDVDELKSQQSETHAVLKSITEDVAFSSKNRVFIVDRSKADQFLEVSKDKTGVHGLLAKSKVNRKNRIEIK